MASLYEGPQKQRSGAYDKSTGLPKGPSVDKNATRSSTAPTRKAPGTRSA